MTTPHCPRCQGSGWVCENHEDRPSDVVSHGGCSCGGAAVPCVCNPEAEFEFAEVFAEVEMPDNEAACTGDCDSAVSRLITHADWSTWVAPLLCESALDGKQ